MKKNEDFYENLAKRESGGEKNPYKAVNRFGYVGKYQMGEDILTDLGYYKKNKGGKLNDWSGTFTGKNGINNIEDFKNNPQVQETAIREAMSKKWEQLEANGSTKYVGQVVGETVITPSGLLAGAHLKGAGGVLNFLKNPNSTKNKDGNGMEIERYIREMGNCEVKNESKNFSYDSQEAETRQATLDNYFGHQDETVDWMGDIISPVVWKKFTSDYIEPKSKEGADSIMGPNSSECKGSYSVSGYTTQGGKKIAGYTRDCWKH